MQNNGSLFLHVFFAESGSPPHPDDSGYSRRAAWGRSWRASLYPKTYTLYHIPTSCMGFSRQREAPRPDGSGYNRRAVGGRPWRASLYPVLYTLYPSTPVRF